MTAKGRKISEGLKRAAARKRRSEAAKAVWAAKKAAQAQPKSRVEEIFGEDAKLAMKMPKLENPADLTTRFNQLTEAYLDELNDMVSSARRYLTGEDKR